MDFPPQRTTLPDPQYVLAGDDGVRIASYTWGDDDAPVALLVHGVGSNARDNWVNTGWVRDLLAAGYRVLAVDLRGHGASDKPHDPAAYSTDVFTADMLQVLDTHLIDEFDVIGYSLGARLAWELAVDAPARVRKAVLGGIPDGRPLAGLDIDQVRAHVEDGVAVTDPSTRWYVALAERVPGNDARALLAIAEGMRAGERDLDTTHPPQQPVLMATGSTDAIVGSTRQLAATVPHGRFVAITGRGHIDTPAARQFRQAGIGFLTGSDDAPTG